MTKLLVSGNVRIAKPAATPHYYAKAGTGDLVAIKAITDTFPVPSWVSGVGGTIGSSRASLTDDQVAYCIMDWQFRNVNFTGGNQVTVPALASVNRAMEIYKWLVGGVGPSGNNYAGNNTLNGGKGPTISCGTDANMTIGMLAAYGIAARSITGGTNTGGSDTTLEYWSPGKPGWVHMLPLFNTLFTLPDGSYASYLDWASIERNNGARTVSGVTLVGTSYKGGATGVNLVSGVSQGDWIGYSAAAAWGRGSAFTTVAAPTAFQTSKLGLLNTLAGGASVTRLTVAHLDDLYPSINALGAFATLDGDRRVVNVELEAVMLNFSAFQVLKPGGAWANIDWSMNGRANQMAAYRFGAISGQTWQFRAIGTLGETTNVVSVTVP